MVLNYVFAKNHPSSDMRCPAAQVLPITVYNSDFTLELRRQIAVSDRFICYALKQGHIRVLSTQSAHRALIKAHTPPLTDLQCVITFPGSLLHAADCKMAKHAMLIIMCRPSWQWPGL